MLCPLQWDHTCIMLSLITIHYRMFQHFIPDFLMECHIYALFTNASLKFELVYVPDLKSVK